MSVVFGKRRDQEYVRFDPYNFSTLVAGDTRFGKTVGCYGILSQVAKLDNVLVCGWDGAGKLLEPQADYHPQLFALGLAENVLDKGIKLIESIVKLMDRRNDWLRGKPIDKISEGMFTAKAPALLVVFDEYPGILEAVQAMKSKKERDHLEGLITRIAQEGGKVGINLLVIAQRPASAAFSTMLRAQLSRRISYHLKEPETTKMVLSDHSPETIKLMQTLPKGRGVIEEPAEDLVIFASPYLDYEEYRERVRKAYERRLNHGEKR